MRQTIGGTWLIQLMVLFIFLFAGYIILTIDYSRTVKVKNETLSIIEKYDGLNEASITLLNNFLLTSGYDVTGSCLNEKGVYGALSLMDNQLEEAQKDQKYYYCVKKYKGVNTTKYYQISLFYRFNLPVIGDASRFTIKGTTSNFQPHDDDLYQYVIGDY